MIEEWLADGDAVRSDPGWQAAMNRRGITDFANVQIDPWPASHFGLDVDASGRRLARCVAYVREFIGDNGYAHPVENLVAIVDRNTHEVVELLDGDADPHPDEPRPLRRREHRHRARVEAVRHHAGRWPRLHGQRWPARVGAVAHARLDASHRRHGAPRDRLPRR